MTTSRTFVWVKIVLLLFVVLLFVAFTPPVQKAWQAWYSETNTKNKTAKAKAPVEKKVTASVVNQQQPVADTGANSVPHEMTEEQKRYMFDVTSISPKPVEVTTVTIPQSLVPGKEVVIAPSVRSVTLIPRASVVPAATTGTAKKRPAPLPKEKAVAKASMQKAKTVHQKAPRVETPRGAHPNWKIICDDKDEFGVPPTVQCP